MQNYRLIAAAVLLAAGAARADTVTLANGDKLTGEIVEVNPKSVIVTSPYAGRLVIDRAAVKTLQSEKAVTIIGPVAALEPRFLSPTADGTAWQETVAYVPPAPAKPATPVRATSYLSISPDWKNQASFGAVNTTGNDETTSLVGNLTFHYNKKPDEFTLKFDGVYGISNGQQNAGLAAETAVFRHDLQNDKFYAYLGDDLRYDAIKGISIQATGTGGLGYWLVKSDKFKADVRGGPGVTYIKTFDGDSNFSPAAEAGIRLDYIFNDRLSAHHETVYTTALTDTEIWRIHSETALLFKLDFESGLGLKLGFNDDYENQVSAGRKNNDTRLALSLTLDF